MNLKFAYDKIFHLLEDEDALINLLNPTAGVFFAPELYLVFQIGKLLKTHEQVVFGAEVKWMREINFGNGGPTDLIFLKGNELFLFEFKVASTLHSYVNDIEKLKRVDLIEVNKRTGFEEVSEIRKYFIALIDVFTKDMEDDPRFLELKGRLKNSGTFKMLSTEYNRYTKDISCLVGLWEIE